MQHNELYVQEAQTLMHRYVWVMYSETYERNFNTDTVKHVKRDNSDDEDLQI